MGQIIENKRKISSDRVRKIRKQKNKIIIAAEGKNKTEKTYFNHFDDGNNKWEKETNEEKKETEKNSNSGNLYIIYHYGKRYCLLQYL